jgi:hypothetical protein
MNIKDVLDSLDEVYLQGEDIQDRFFKLWHSLNRAVENLKKAKLLSAERYKEIRKAWEYYWEGVGGVEDLLFVLLKLLKEVRAELKE